MQKLVEVGIIALAAASVAIADSLIKKSAFHTSSFYSALKNPLILIAIVLYMLQIILFAYVFVKRWDLGIVGLMQMIIYAAIVITVGIIFFQEKITWPHGIGMAFALFAAILMNI